MRDTRIKPFTVFRNLQTGAFKLLEWEDVGKLFTKEDCDSGGCEGIRQTAELWGHVTGFKAIALAKDSDGNVAEISGVQTLCHLHPDGNTNMRGSLSFKGEYHLGVTALETFELPDGRLIVADIIQVLPRTQKRI